MKMNMNHATFEKAMTGDPVGRHRLELKIIRLMPIESLVAVTRE
jgi:hypothetical protein